MIYTQDDLEMAVRHVKEAEARIARQRALIRRLERDDHPTETAYDLFNAMNETARHMRAHLKQIRAELGGQT